MIDIRAQLNNKRDGILTVAKKYGASNLKIFGSVIRGEANENSDIDFLVAFEDNRSLFDVIGLKQELEEMLERNVDIVTGESLHWYIKDKVLNEALPL
ncbi:MAG TPA: nucleotidyltransferase family protein [Bacilli bacterium]